MSGPHLALTAPIFPLSLRAWTSTPPTLAATSNTYQAPRWLLLTSPALPPSFERCMRFCHRHKYGRRLSRRRLALEDRASTHSSGGDSSTPRPRWEHLWRATMAMCRFLSPRTRRRDLQSLGPTSSYGLVPHPVPASLRWCKPHKRARGPLVPGPPGWLYSMPSQPAVIAPRRRWPVLPARVPPPCRSQ